MDKPIVASNTGPLISAFQCGQGDLLKRYFAAIDIAASQLEEFERHGAATWIRELIDEGFVKVIADLSETERAEAEAIAGKIAASPLATVRDLTHHLPEAEAMVLMQRPELACRAILLEELAARQIAQDLHLAVTGFVAVLVRATQEGILTGEETYTLLKTCQQQGTRYSNPFIEAVTRPFRR